MKKTGSSVWRKLIAMDCTNTRGDRNWNWKDDVADRTENRKKSNIQYDTKNVIVLQSR